MRNKLEYILLSLLLGLTVLLGLSFWLNTNFGFNLFYREHWQELAQLQASQTPVNQNFYISIAFAVLIFLIGLIAIYVPMGKKNTRVKNDDVPLPPAPVIEKPEQTPDIPAPVMPVSRPPRLNLPKNISEIATHKHEEIIQNQVPANAPIKTSEKYSHEFSEIFSNNGFSVKTNPTISGFTPNLFAIGNGEILWIGATNCDIETMKKSVHKLQTVFHETLEDIEIHVHAFILDTLQKYDSADGILIFHNIDELREFISENPASTIEEPDQDNFNAYSEYIDTIIQYIKNI